MFLTAFIQKQQISLFNTKLLSPNTGNCLNHHQERHWKLNQNIKQQTHLPWHTLPAGQWWRTPLIPAVGRQRQEVFWVRGQPGLQSEFQDSWGYTEKPYLEKNKTKQTNKTSKPASTVTHFLSQGHTSSMGQASKYVSLWGQSYSSHHTPFMDKETISTILLI